MVKSYLLVAFCGFIWLSKETTTIQRALVFTSAVASQYTRVLKTYDICYIPDKGGILNNRECYKQVMKSVSIWFTGLFVLDKTKEWSQREDFTKHDGTYYEYIDIVGVRAIALPYIQSPGRKIFKITSNNLLKRSTNLVERNFTLEYEPYFSEAYSAGEVGLLLLGVSPDTSDTVPLKILEAHNNGTWVISSMKLLEERSYEMRNLQVLSESAHDQWYIKGDDTVSLRADTDKK